MAKRSVEYSVTYSYVDLTCSHDENRITRDGRRFKEIGKEMASYVRSVRQHPTLYGGPWLRKHVESELGPAELARLEKASV